MSNKGRKYGRSRTRRRRGLLALLAVLAGLAALPFALGAPETVREAIYPLRYEETIRQASRENDLEPAFVAGVIHAESRFRPDAESYQEAYGLMQMLPDTAAFVQQRSGIRGDYREPRTNIRLGAWYLGYLDERYRGNERLMLAAYNSGEGTVDGWISDEGFDIATDIPFKETRQYVERALEARQKYEDLYGKDLRRNTG
ncbi:MAG: lytic transglycosylase domain-containing protein [Rubrobacter sp.]|nr:lytic transglycosylase domain-containing protein [Rubrobacter sp.]MDQ3360271.1 lytic transglycosylase domain-containing protein [Actinomycetota bacterium]MDQ3377468.1 lytic transglycosylase domain-containing protein [Actinomycetota bacterium]